MVSGTLIAAMVLNAAIAVLEILVLTKLSNKKDICKYYTYLSNLIAAFVSAVFFGFALYTLLSGNPYPLWLKGLRFVSTYMLVTTLFIFSLVLLPSRKAENTITEKDFTGVRPQIANLILHYLCPVLSAVSFLLLERQPVLADPIWTLLSAIPTILYWLVYLFLSIAKLWKDPYGFFEPSQKPKTFLNTLTDCLIFLLIPALSIGLHFLLWWISNLNF